MKIDLKNHNCEIGITIGNTNYWGKPHSTEAIILLLKHCFNNLKLHIVNLNVFETNGRAIRFFEKVGFTHDGKMRETVLKNNEYLSMILMSFSSNEFMLKYA